MALFLQFSIPILLSCCHSISCIQIETCLCEVIDKLSVTNGYVGFYYSTGLPPSQRLLEISSYADRPSRTVAWLMAQTDCTFYMYSKNLKYMPSNELIKRFDLNILLVWIETYRPQGFTNFLKLFRSHRVIGPNTRILIFLEKYTQAEEEIAEEVIQLIWNNLRSFYSTVAINGREEIFFYTVDAPQRNMPPRKINKWNGKFEGNNFFSELSNDFQGYVLSVGSSIQNNYEINIIQEIAQSLNMSCEVNDTLNVGPGGVLEMVSEFKADVGCGTLMIFPLAIAFSSPLMPYAIQELIFIAPKFVGTINWTSMFTAFSLNIWLLVLMSIIGFSLPLAFSNYQKDHSLDLIVEMIMCHIEISVTNSKLLKCNKPLVGFLLLYCLVMTTLYKSRYTTLMTMPPEPSQIRTIEEAYDKRLHFFYFRTHRLLMNHTNQNTWNKILEPGHSSTMDDPSAIMDTVIKEKKAFALIQDYEFKSVVVKLYRNEGGCLAAERLPEAFSIFPMCIVFGPGHSFQPAFQDKQFSFIESGLNKNWQHGPKCNFRVPKETTRKAMPLTMMIAPLCVLGMLLVSSCIFLVELAYVRRWNYLLMLK